MKPLLIVGVNLAGTGLFLFVLFTLLDVFFARPVWDDLQLDMIGVPAVATPLSLKRQGTGHQSGNTTTSHVITVRYTDKSGVSHDAWLVSIDQDVISRAVAKKPVAIEYHPHRPDLVRLEGSRAATFGYYTVLPLLGSFIGFALMGLAGFIHLRRSRRRLRDAAQEPGPTLAARG